MTCAISSTTSTNTIRSIRKSWSGATCASICASASTRRPSVDESDGAFRVLLDGKPVKTPARRNLAAPSRALAQNIADEWDAQKDVIDPGKMPLTRLANSIIDGVVDAPGPVAEEIEKYLGSDLLFYRADGPEGLTKAQETHWDPVVAWARDDLGARFILAEGVVFAPQPEEAIKAARTAIPGIPGRWARCIR